MNGRLAMIGFSGMLHHAILTKQGPITQIVEQNFVRPRTQSLNLVLLMLLSLINQRTPWSDPSSIAH